MGKNSKNVSARISFVADKVLSKMKKCLVKKDRAPYRVYPAVELETGVMVATDGHILAAHKLGGYRYEQSEDAVLGGMLMLPVEVLTMKGTIHVEVVVENCKTVITATDGNGDGGVLVESARYPNWRSPIPRCTGYPIEMDAKAWDGALKGVVPKLSDPYPVRLYGEEKSKTIGFYYNDEIGEEESVDAAVGEMPYKVVVSFGGKRLRNVMAFEPREMRFVDNTRPVLFCNDDTLVLLMPLLQQGAGLNCTVEKRYLDVFDLEKWLAGNHKAAVTRQHTQQLSLADRLRAALLERLAA